MIVLITGSSRGIGKEIARRFAENGAYVVLNCANSLNELKKTYKEFTELGYSVTHYQADVANYEQCKKMFEYIHNLTGQFPSVVVNNAGIGFSNLFTDTAPDMWHKVINTNLTSAYNCSYVAVPHMLQKKAGSIINISSIWGNVGASCEVAYSTSKSGLNGFTKALAKELGPSNIRVNAIACGWIDTQMNEMYSNEERELFKEEIPLMRAGTVTDVANLCWFLAQDTASYITGQIITLDGGLT